MPSPQEREEALFRAAVELTPDALRGAFLDQACAGDAVLRQRLGALLAAYESPGNSLATAAGPAAKATMKVEFPEDQPDESVGQTLGRYKLLERVGEGGCGVVYVAEQTEPVRRRVALKVIKLGMDTKQVVARFEAERQALAMMDHPNIAKVLDAGTTELGRPYFVMELVRGIRITDYCDQANLSTKERLDLFIKVCQAIQHAHQKGIIHRDIKPSNILVTLHDGVPVPKVIDFGIAKATEGRLTDNTVYTQLHQFIGTPAYMSPEQAEMSGLDIDTRSDIYSLGVLLYELLAGSTPFDAKELMASGIDAMRRTIREKEPQRPSTRLATLGADQLTTTAKRRSADTSKLLHQLKGDLDWIVMKCLEKDRQRRYDTANGIAADLKRHLNNEPVVARPPSTAYRMQKAFRRNKLPFVAGTAVSVALLLGIIAAASQAIRATHAQREALAARQDSEANEKVAVGAQASEARLREQAQADAQTARRRAYAADMNVAQQALRNGNLGRTRELLNSHVPKEGEPDLRGFEWRYLWGLSRGNAEKIVQAFEQGPASCLSYSPDGKLLVTANWFGQVNLWNIGLEDGVTVSQKLMDGSPERRAGLRQSMAFSSDGKLVAMALNKELIVCDAATWKVRSNLGEVHDSGFIGTLPVEFLRNDKWIAARVETGVMVRNLSSNEQQIIPGNGTSFGSLLAWCPGPAVLAIADGTEIQLWDSGKKVVRKRIGGSDSILVGLAASRRGDFLAAGRKDGSVDLISIAEERVLRTWKAHASLTFALDFSPDGQLLATGGADQSIHLWELAALSRSPATPEPIRTLLGHESQVWDLGISPDGRQLASVDKNGWLALWRIRPTASSAVSTDTVLEFDALPAGAPTFVQVQAEQARSADGKLVAERLIQAGAIEVREAQSGQLVSTFPSRTDLASMAISPSNSILAAGAHNTFISVFGIATGKERLVLRGHLTSPSALAFTRDDRTLASGGTDGTVKLWSLETGQEMISLSFPHGTVANLKFSKNGQTLGVQFAESPTIEYLPAPSWVEINSAETEQKAEINQP